MNIRSVWTLRDWDSRLDGMDPTTEEVFSVAPRPRGPEKVKNSRKKWKIGRFNAFVGIPREKSIFRKFSIFWRFFVNFIKNDPPKNASDAKKKGRFSKFRTPRKRQIFQKKRFVADVEFGRDLPNFLFLRKCSGKSRPDGSDFFRIFSWGFGAKKNRKSAKDAGRWLAVYRFFDRFLTTPPVYKNHKNHQKKWKFRKKVKIS